MKQQKINMLMNWFIEVDQLFASLSWSSYIISNKYKTLITIFMPLNEQEHILVELTKTCFAFHSSYNRNGSSLATCLR